MLRTLRNRLILSHILPLLIIIPLAGAAILYALETQVLLPNLSRELSGEARLLAEIARDQPQIWEDASFAQDLLSQVRPDLAARVEILDSDGMLFASSDPADAGRMGQALDVPDFTSGQDRDVVAHVDYSSRLHGEIVDVYAPVTAADGEMLGIIRMSYRFTTVYEQFIQLRYLIVTILAISLAAGTLLGSSLALNISAPLQRVIRAIDDLARGYRKEELAEEGPEEVRRLLRSVNHLRERLHNLEESRSLLLASLVHEIGRPLGALHAALQALSSEPDLDPRLLAEMLGGMIEETRRLQYLLDDLAQLHDQVLGALELDRHAEHPSEWLPGILHTWEAAAREKGLRWEVSIPSGLPTILIDPLRLAQVVGNLVNNAIKFTPPGGAVSIAAGCEGNWVWMRVSDTGPGITDEEQAKIFTPFYRGPEGGRITQGMGLGLSIARDLVDAHGGRLEVASQPGLGSQFTIWLPG